MQTGGASEVQLAGGPTQPSNDAPAAQPPPHRRAPSDAPSTSASEFSTTDTSMTDAFRRDARGFEDDENFRHEHRTGARPTLTTVQEVDVLSVYPGFEHIESEQRPLMKELSENVVRWGAAANVPHSSNLWLMLCACSDNPFERFFFVLRCSGLLCLQLEPPLIYLTQ